MVSKHQVRGDFRVQVSGHRHAGGPGDRRGAQPPGHAADSHQVRHEVVPRGGEQRLVKRAGAVEVLAELDRRAAEAASSFAKPGVR